ncbi:TatD family hydrolase [Pedobacter sp. SAFR-022]|uniref:TatD family hydrolase n=1 Tax=Pedobacter sp. SAFR-022 TaxID=3436861 RepID=UPI003F7DF03D
MLLTDTHTHLYYETDEVKQAALLQRCFDQGIDRLFLPNVDVASISRIDELVSRYPENCFAMSGLHPCEVGENYADVLAEIKANIPSRKIYAIGEIGIDLYWDKSTLKYQQEAFAIQIGWAKEMGLPIVIHCREAFDEVFEVLEQHKDEKLFGILHCFTGNVEQARRCIDLGFYLGIGGVLTYKKANLDLVLYDIPLEHIVLETDSPYLAPVPFRGKPNESSYLIHIAKKVAEIYQLSVEEVAEITTANSRKIFNV